MPDALKRYEVKDGTVVGVLAEQAPPPPVPGVPAALATPSGFSAEARAQLAEALNHLAADAVALYLKTKNFHWHVSGPHFRDYHLLFDEQADQILATVDELAERVRKLGATTLHSVGDVAKRKTVVDDDAEFVTPADMLRRLLADNQDVATAQRAAIALADKLDDTATSNLLQGHLDGSERRVWFLFSCTQGG